MQGMFMCLAHFKHIQYIRQVITLEQHFKTELKKKRKSI